MNHYPPYCQIDFDGSAFVVRFGGLADDFLNAVANLKDRIPPAARTYDPRRKVWRISTSYRAQLLAWRRDWFTGETPSGARTDDPYAVLYLRPEAPPVLVHAAYRALAKQQHPDVGGTDQAMRRLNAAYERLREQLPA